MVNEACSNLVPEEELRNNSDDNPNCKPKSNDILSSGKYKTKHIIIKLYNYLNILVNSFTNSNRLGMLGTEMFSLNMNTVKPCVIVFVNVEQLILDLLWVLLSVKTIVI